MTTSALEMWVVYEKPLDYPEHYVVRRHVIGPGEVKMDEACFVAPSLRAARAFLAPKGLYRLGRALDDDPVIVETWV